MGQHHIELSGLEPREIRRIYFLEDEAERAAEADAAAQKMGLKLEFIPASKALDQDYFSKNILFTPTDLVVADIILKGADYDGIRFVRLLDLLKKRQNPNCYGLEQVLLHTSAKDRVLTEQGQPVATLARVNSFDLFYREKAVTPSGVTVSYEKTFEESVQCIVNGNALPEYLEGHTCLLNYDPLMK